MFNFITIAFLTGTSVAPVIFVYSTMALLAGSKIEAIILVLAGMFLATMASWLLHRARTRMETFSLTINSLESADRENMGVLILYLAPLLETSFDMLDWTILVPMGALFFALTLTGNSYQFNPLLNVFGWHFYKVGTPEGVTYIFITKRFIPNLHSPFIVTQMTNYTVVETLERR